MYVLSMVDMDGYIVATSFLSFLSLRYLRGGVHLALEDGVGSQAIIRAMVFSYG